MKEMTLTLRRAEAGDIDGMMVVYDAAREIMRKNGNLTQWVNGYPSRETVAADIAAGVSHVAVDASGRIVMAFAFIIGEDPTYAVIEDGAWLNDRPYGTIHRMGSDGSYSGMLRMCVGYCLGHVDNLRLDTHADNTIMQRAAERLGFVRCGVIYCQDGTPREAYHLVRESGLCAR